MGKGINRLTARAVQTISKRGFYADGGGLYLQVAEGSGRSWVFRFQKEGRPRWMGLGSVDLISLKEARMKSLDARKLLLEGEDPIEARITAKRLKQSKINFRVSAERYIESQRPGWRNKKHASQWNATFEAYVFPVFGDIPVETINTGMIEQALKPIWNSKAETASRLRARIEAVLGWATAHGYRQGENPARWRGHLEKLLPRRTVAVKHHAALPYQKVGAFMEALREREGVSARALELTILCATRTSETIEACWKEIDFDAAVWVVPGERMKAKAGNDHRIPLSPQVMNLLRELGGRNTEDQYIFPGVKQNRPLSSVAMLAVLKRMGTTDLTVHGFRSTFRDWSADCTDYSQEVCEMALAHAIVNKVEAAYRRGDLMEKRRLMMADWSNYCDRGSPILKA